MLSTQRVNLKNNLSLHTQIYTQYIRQKLTYCKKAVVLRIPTKKK